MVWNLVKRPSKAANFQNVFQTMTQDFYWQNSNFKTPKQGELRNCKGSSLSKLASDLL